MLGQRFDSIDDAIARQDSGAIRTWLEREKREGPTLTSVLSSMIASGGWVCHLALLEVLNRIQRGADPSAFTSVVPRTVDGPPESQILLARIYVHLWPSMGASEFPVWSEFATHPAARIAWLGAELTTHPGRISGALVRCQGAGDVAQLRQALSCVDLAWVTDLPVYLTQCVKLGESMHPSTLDMTLAAVARGLLAPRHAREIILELTKSGDPKVRVSALRELALPWCLVAGSTELPSVTESDLESQRAFLTLYAAHRRPDPLWRAFRESASLPVRIHALELLSPFVVRSDLDGILQRCWEDPLAYAPSLLRFLRQVHHRGIFVRPEHAESLLALFLVDVTVEAEGMALVAFPIRHALFGRLEDLPESQWARASELALAFGQGPQGSVDVPVVEWLEKCIENAQDPRPYLDAVARLGATSAESSVLAVLDRWPRESLRALRIVGGSETVEALRLRLGEGGDIQVSLRDDRNEALELLWLLLDRDGRREWVGRLNPGRIPRGILNNLGTLPEGAELDVLVDPVHWDRWEAPEYLCALCRVAGSDQLPLIRDLLLRVIVERTRDLNATSDRTFGVSILDRCLEALRGMGSRLWSQGSIRPACLLEAADREGARHELLGEVLISLLDRPLEDGEMVTVLRSLESVRSRAVFPAVYRLFRTKSQTIVKAALWVFGRSGADALALHLVRATERSDPGIVVAALKALEAVFERNPNAPLELVQACVSALDHPSMNVKKAAASALSKRPSVEAVRPLLFWLSRHDNSGFRDDLIVALRNTLGQAFLAIVIDALEASTDASSQEHLFRALDHEIPSSVARRWRGSRLESALQGLLESGELTLADGETRDPSRMRTGRDGLEKVAEPLMNVGWSPAVANQLYASMVEADPSISGGLLGQYGPHAREILDAASRFVGIQRWRMVGLALAAVALPSSQELEWLLPRASFLSDVLVGLSDHLLSEPSAFLEETRELILDCFEQLLTLMERGDALAFVDRWRSLPVLPNRRGRSRLGLVRAGGAVLTRQDVDRALSAARMTSDPIGLERAILLDAFGLDGIDPAPWTQEHEIPESDEDLRTSVEEWGGYRTLCALVQLHLSVRGVAKVKVLDRMEELQPLGVTGWIHSPPVRVEKMHRDPEVGRSSRRLEALQASLQYGQPPERLAAALVLASWPDPRVRAILARSYLEGRFEGTSAWLTRSLALGLLSLRVEPDWVALRTRHGGRILELMGGLESEERRDLLPDLLVLWEQGSEAETREARRWIRTLPGDFVLRHVEEQLKQGDWRYLSLLESVMAGAYWSELMKGVNASAVRTVEGPLVGSCDRPIDWQSLRQRPELRLPETREELFARARGDDVEAARKALSRLSERPDEAFVALLIDRATDAESRIRRHVHRLLRTHGPKSTYLDCALRCLDQEKGEVAASLVRVLAYGGYAPACRAIVERLTDAHPAVRRASREGLVRLGRMAEKELERARSAARPDRRAIYEAVLAEIQSAESVGSRESSPP